MKKKIFTMMRAAVLMVIMSVCGVTHLKADDGEVYVSLSGSGDYYGSSTTDAYSFAQFTAYWASNAVKYVDSVSTIKVYFVPGIYTMSAAIALRANSAVCGLTIDLDYVIIDNCRNNS